MCCVLKEGERMKVEPRAALSSGVSLGQKYSELGTCSNEMFSFDTSRSRSRDPAPHRLTNATVRCECCYSDREAETKRANRHNPLLLAHIFCTSRISGRSLKCRLARYRIIISHGNYVMTS